MTDPVSALLGLAHALRGHGPLSRFERDFLADGLERWVVADGELSLDQALGLRVRGGVSQRRALALDERNMLLRRLYRTHPEWSALAPGAAARSMAASSDRYFSTRWPRERDATAAPASEPAATWWRIARSGLPVPGIERLRQILDHQIQSGV